MKAMVCALAIDGPNLESMQRWLKSGKLPVIQSLIENGVTAQHFHTKQYRNDRCWDILLSGHHDATLTGSHFDPDTYDYYNESLQREERYEPFYALGTHSRTCAFDLPATLSDKVEGIQVFGWGSELNASVAVSSPQELMSELEERFGVDPKLKSQIKVLDHKTQEIEKSYVIPNLYDEAELSSFKEDLLTSVEKRADICLDLLGREEWNLFLANFIEVHTANHLLWHMGEDHPVNATPPECNAILEVFQAIDRAFGKIISALPEDAKVVVYTIDDTRINSMDLPSMAMLPEMLFRWNFRDEAPLATSDLRTGVPPIRLDYKEPWKHELWKLVTKRGQLLLQSPSELESQGNPMSWHPAVWYQRHWNRMRAFSLPSVSDGYVRINVKGREANGLVDPTDFQDEIRAVSDIIQSLKDPTTGKSLVKALTVTRKTPFELPEIPPDLIVSWNDKSIPADCCISDTLGSIGPLPYFRTGGHHPHGNEVEGTLIISGQGIQSGQSLAPAQLEDIPATILGLMGVAPQTPITGRDILRTRVDSASLSLAAPHSELRQNDEKMDRSVRAEDFG